MSADGVNPSLDYHAHMGRIVVPLVTLARAHVRIYESAFDRC
jgi:hypothetical protein